MLSLNTQLLWWIFFKVLCNSPPRRCFFTLSLICPLFTYYPFWPLLPKKKIFKQINVNCSANFLSLVCCISAFLYTFAAYGQSVLVVSWIWNIFWLFSLKMWNVLYNDYFSIWAKQIDISNSSTYFLLSYPWIISIEIFVNIHMDPFEYILQIFCFLDFYFWIKHMDRALKHLKQYNQE